MILWLFQLQSGRQCVFLDIQGARGHRVHTRGEKEKHDDNERRVSGG